MQSVGSRPGSKRAAPGVPTSRGGDNSIQTWGLEAPHAERIRATTVVQAFLDARARADWAGACAYLAAEQRRMHERLLPKMSGNAGAEAMRRLAVGVPTGAFEREADIRKVLSLRVGGGKAFLIYKRLQSEVYATALAQDSGAWKVVSVGPAALN